MVMYRQKFFVYSAVLVFVSFVSWHFLKEDIKGLIFCNALFLFVFLFSVYNLFCKEINERNKKIEDFRLLEQFFIRSSFFSYSREVMERFSKNFLDCYYSGVVPESVLERMIETICFVPENYVIFRDVVISEMNEPFTFRRKNTTRASMPVGKEEAEALACKREMLDAIFKKMQEISSRKTGIYLPDYVAVSTPFLKQTIKQHT